MRSRNVNYIVVGLFVLAMLGALIVALVALTAPTGGTDRYLVMMDNVADVKFGTQVRYEGYPIGQVERITPVPEGGRMRFRLELGVAKDWRIPSDSIARIATSSFLAAKTIDIASGTSDRALSPGDSIAGAPPADVYTAMSKVAGEISALSHDSIKPLIDGLGALALRLGGALEQDMTRLLASLNAIAGTVERGTPAITASIESTAVRLDDSARRLQQVLSDENVAAVDRAIGHIEKSSETFAAISGELNETARKVDQVVAGIDALVADNRGTIDRSLTDAQYALRSIAQNIDTIIHNLDGTSRNMNEFSRLIRQNPSLLLGGTPRAEPVSAPRAAGSGFEPGLR